MASASEQLTYSLIGDIGGTNARLQVISYVRDTHQPTDVKTLFYKTADFPNFKSCLKEFLKEFEGTEKYPQNAVLAWAGPVYNRKVILSNNTAWFCDEEDIENEFKMKPISIINDFVAIGYAMLHLKEENLEMIQEAPRLEHTTMIVAGCGTGMGECILQPIKHSNGTVSYTVYATEGGHKAFSPSNQTEWDYMNFVMNETGVKDQFSYLSAERSFCGPGIPNIYLFFCKQQNVVPKKLTSEEIVQLGVSNEDEICKLATDFFITLYGKELSNFALSTLPYGGIFLVGGLTRSILGNIKKDKEGPFQKGFFSKGKSMNPTLEKCPMFYVNLEQPGLVGCFVKAKRDAYKL